MVGQRFRLEQPEITEYDLHVAAADALSKLICPPAQWCCYPAGHVRLEPYQQARLTRVGLKRGWPDLLILHGKVFGIELKKPGGTLSKTRIVRTRRGAPRELLGQEDVFPLLLQTGAFGDIRTATSLAELFSHLNDWKVPLRTRVSF